VGRKWETPGILSILQFAWSMSLSGLRVGAVAVSHASSHLDDDELFMDLALEGRVFHVMPELLLAAPSVAKEEFYQRRLHVLVTDFLTLMPLKIKELRNRADDAARNKMMHEQEGIQYNVPLVGQHFQHLLYTIPKLYAKDTLDLRLGENYWCPTDGVSGATDTRNCPTKQVSLYKFVRLAGDLLMPSLFVPYVNMLAGLADSPGAAAHCFNLLKMNGNGSSNVSLDHFFQSLNQYHQNLKAEQPMGPDHTIYRTKPLSRGISPQEIAGLSAVLDLVCVLCRHSEAARVAVAENPGWSAVPTMIGLVGCPVPTTIKYRLLHCLAALAKSTDIVHPLWQAIETAQLIGTTGGRPGLVSELEEVESRAEEFPLTKAFLSLLNTLTDTEIPGGLGAGTREPGFLPYLGFIQDNVFLKFNTRTYKDPGEKWDVAASCLSILHKLLSEYEPLPEHFDGPSNAIGHHPGFYIMSHLHQTSQLLRCVLFVLDEAKNLLDTFAPFAGKDSLETAATAALQLLQTGLQVGNSFLSAGRAAGASVVLTSLPLLLLGMNPRTGRPDHMLNIAKFISYGFWLPAARLAAVKVMAGVAEAPAHQPQLLATLTANKTIANMVIKGFTDALDADEEEDIEGIDRNVGATRLAVLELLQTGLGMSPPSLAHFLLGFDLNKGVSRSQLQSPSIVGVRTPFHAILGLLTPSEPGTPSPTLSRAPHFSTAAYKLIFTLSSNPITSDPTLRYLRSSCDFFPSQLACITYLVGETGVQPTKSAAWLLRSTAVEVRALAKARQTSQLARILGLLLDAVDNLEDTMRPGAASLYTDNTLSQLSRTMPMSQTRQLEAPAANHRLATILNCIDFEVEAMPTPSWEVFDDHQVSAVLSQCEGETQDSGHERLILVPKLHRILAAELSNLQGSTALNQRALIQQEIQSILLYAVRWNGVQEGAAARRDLLDAWRQVTEVLLISSPPELLPSSSKKQILLQLLQTLLNKVSGEDSVPGLEGLVSSAVLLLLTSLRGTYENTPDRKMVMGETFVGILDGTQLVETHSAGQPYSASLQVILRGLISWIIGAGGGSQLIRTNLYAALLAFLRIGKSSSSSDNSAMLELSECGKLHKANLEVVSSYGPSFIEVVSRDACAGHEVRRMLALAVLDELVCLDKQGAAVRFLSNQGFLKHLIESLIMDEPGLIDLLTRQTGNVRDLYVYESKMGVLSRVAASATGAELLLQAGLMARLAEFTVLGLRPDPDAALLIKKEEETVGALDRYHSILFPALRLAQSVLASLGGENQSASAQTLHFLTGHEEVLSLILRGSVARSSLHPSLLQELALVTAVVSRAATLDFQAEVVDASSLELSGQLSRIQRQMLSLLSVFQLTPSLVSATVTTSTTLVVLQILSNVAGYARTIVSSSSSNSRSCRIIVTPSLMEAVETSDHIPGGPSRPASLGLLVMTTRYLAAQVSRSQNEVLDLADRESAVASMPGSELAVAAGVAAGDKLPAATLRRMATAKIQEMAKGRRQEVSLSAGAAEACSFIIWRHLEHFLLYSSAAANAGPGTPYQAAVRRMNDSALEMGNTSIASPRNAFSKGDLERLRGDVVTVLNDAFFEKLASVDKVHSSKTTCPGFLQAMVRRVKRLANLHTH